MTSPWTWVANRIRRRVVRYANAMAVLQQVEGAPEAKVRAKARVEAAWDALSLAEREQIMDAVDWTLIQAASDERCRMTNVDRPAMAVLVFPGALR